MTFFNQYEKRREYIKDNGFVCITSDNIAAIPIDQPIISVGCGTATLEASLKEAGADIIATDIHTSPVHNPYSFHCQSKLPIQRMTATKAVKTYPDRTVLMSWPCYNRQWPTYALRAMVQGQRLLYIGEGPYGCTGADSFHNTLDEHFIHRDTRDLDQWYGIYDQLYIYRRK